MRIVCGVLRRSLSERHPAGRLSDREVSKNSRTSRDLLAMRMSSARVAGAQQARSVQHQVTPGLHSK